MEAAAVTAKLNKERDAMAHVLPATYNPGYSYL
jgi:hypothetical protein